MPLTIFVTAYDRYAMKAFEVHALDYLLKPVGKERLAEALDQCAQAVAASVGGDVPAARARSAWRISTRGRMRRSAS